MARTCTQTDRAIGRATFGVMWAASLAVAMTGHTRGQARSLITKHAIKQLGRPLSNSGPDILRLHAE